VILDLSWPELFWLAGASLAAGLVRGFAGFGTAMIYLPLAAQVLTPIQAIITLVSMDVLGPIPNLPGAWRAANRPDLARLMAGVAMGLPLGLYILTLAGPETYRTVVSAVSLLLVVALIMGFRYARALPPKGVLGTGVLGGVLGGFTGMPGPPVILSYLAGPHPPAMVRAMMMLYLYGYDAMMLAVVSIAGWVNWPVLLLGFLLGLPNLIGNVLGGWAFRPGKERLYRNVAYLAIVVAALSSLPFWS
jgi:uncharacterized membrane protein YfcA